jgi:ADP-ribose pyrophosphatase YjhB (NUDIX family)
MENTDRELNTSLNIKLLQISKRMKAIAATGLVYSEDEYNRDRYTEMSELSDVLLGLLTGTPAEVIHNFYLDTKEYPTPKTDVRAVIFNEHGKLLLVREKSDNKWSLPGGWADIGYSASEVAVKEVAEETGLVVKPVKLLAVLDKKNFPHPAQPEYVYKHFIACEILGGSLTTAHDISEVAYFSRNEVPALSEIRVVRQQIDLMFEFLDDRQKPAIFD